jgi:nucleoside phosphorylase
MDGVCAAIQRAKERKRNIYLLLDREGLSDISDEMPEIASATHLLTAETLGELLNQKALTPLTSADYGARTVVKKLSSHDKAVLALSLAKCLLEFFNDDMEVASRSWNPDKIYFVKSTKSRREDRTAYISLEPSSQHVGLPQDTIELGNPILLSFAKLLLEIKFGERITARIDFESTENLLTWAEMCKLLDRMEKTEGSNYLRAVKECLYLHSHCNVAMRQVQDPADEMILGDVIRNTIQEQIVRELELMVHPESSKRKRRDSVSELPLSKKLFISTPAPCNAQRIEVPPRNDTPFAEPGSRTDFDIAIICAIPLEFDAIAAAVDEFWDRDYGKAVGDTNIYTNARIGKYNVAILVLSEIGKVSAVTACTHIQQSYPAVDLVLVSGICGGVPFPGDSKEVLLGDVIISRHVVQYDLGRLYANGFKMRDTVQDTFGRPSENVRNLLSLFDTNRGLRRLENLASSYLQELQARAIQGSQQGGYEYPGASQDQLYQPRYEHLCHGPSPTRPLEAPKASACTHSKSRRTLCDDAGCDSAQLVPRDRLQLKKKQEEAGLVKEAQAPSIFVGTVGSGDTVMKSGEKRDDIASTHGLLAFEMEGAGVWGKMPCLIIKGICDYADSHKNKDWQNFSAATAASVTKALLSLYTQPDKQAAA